MLFVLDFTSNQCTFLLFLLGISDRGKKCKHAFLNRNCSCPIHLSLFFLLAFLTELHGARTCSPAHPRGPGRVSAGPRHSPLPLPCSSAVPAPSLLCWHVDRCEVSAFFLVSTCKHLFMGFLLMHSILGKAKRTTFL